ncbi:unnamed protein product [Cuscuta epithymum]|uniref:High chlorophyll fluorescence 153 n=1 Tax=Cuscuta epithymum TaxID=186058 RepID=A0AAV0E371_9ASTE|nr:unnamed protein product [Cuscuta epithymum]
MAGLHPLASSRIFNCPRLSVSYSAHRSSLLSVAPPPSISNNLQLRSQRSQRRRGSSVVTRAGTSNYIFAFLFPMTLLAVTVLTSIRIADKLDQKFMEEVPIKTLSELVIEQSILESEEDDGDAAGTSPKEETESSCRPNRPKRQADTPST